MIKSLIHSKMWNSAKKSIAQIHSKKWFWKFKKPMSFWRSHAESVIHSSRIFRNSRMSLRKRLLSKAWGLKVKQIVDTFENLRFQLKKVCQIVNTFEKVILKVNKNCWVFEGRMPKVWYIRHLFSEIEGCPYENHHFGGLEERVERAETTLFAWY